MFARLLALLFLACFCVFAQEDNGHHQMKRFYAWEDAKRSVNYEPEDTVKEKRKFYAWAGKRSGRQSWGEPVF